MGREDWAASVVEKIKKKYPEVVKRNSGKIPYTAVNGTFDDQTDKDIGWWTNGFYGGILWQLYHLTGEELYREKAEELEDKLDAVLMNYNSMDHDSGFRFLVTAVADYRISGKKASKNRGLLAAANLAGRFNPQGNFIRAWNDENGQNAGWAIIDCMMNLPLLYWASEMTNDPRFYQIAVRHADTAMKYFIREDGSARHIVEFDPHKGNFVKDFGGQGYAQGSSWTRGMGALWLYPELYLHGQSGISRHSQTCGCLFYSQYPGKRTDTGRFQTAEGACGGGFLCGFDRCKRVVAAFQGALRTTGASRRTQKPVCAVSGTGGCIGRSCGG